MNTDTKTLSERLRHAATTAANDDYSKPMTDERRRYIDRIDTMLEAADALDANAALLREARDKIAEIIGIQDFTARHPAAARLSEREIAAYRTLLSKLTEATKP